MNCKEMKGSMFFSVGLPDASDDGSALRRLGVSPPIKHFLYSLFLRAWLKMKIEGV